MTSQIAQNQRVVSGMRPTGKLHIGHYHGAIKNWIQLQKEFECFFFVADWHALTTHYEQDADTINGNIWEMIIDWLACGVDPNHATLFIQSRIPQHAELNLLLSMMTPLGWLERMPTYKEQKTKLSDKDLSTHGFLGYPVLQSADILLYHATHVPVGEDQVPHIELTREIARRFNYLYGRASGFEEQAEATIKKLGKKSAKLYRQLRNAYTERGDHGALLKGVALLQANQNLALSENELLQGYLEGGGRIVLNEPEAQLTKFSKVPGVDGEKMSKSYHNTIALRDDPTRVEKALRSMKTDPARVRRHDPGDPNRCPVWQLHHIYTPENTKSELAKGCREGSIGCLDCKQPLIEAILKEQAKIKEKAQPYVEDPALVRNIIAEGNDRARETAEETLQKVRSVMHLDYY